MADDRAAQMQAMADQIRICLECRLSQSRHVAVPGEGPLDAELFWVGEAPGASEDRQGRPFIGASGRLLRTEMQSAGFDPEQMFITSVVKCRPPGNRQPRADEKAICSGLYLVRQMELVAPRAVVVLGATAAGVLLAGDIKMTEEHGTWRQDYSLAGQWLPVFVTYHPAAALRSERWRDELRADLQTLAKTRRRIERRR